MSLRLRLLLVMGLAVVALAAAALALVQVVRDSDASRLAAAEASNDVAVESLARAYRDRAASLPQLHAAAHGDEAAALLHETASAELRTVMGTIGGYCFADGFNVEAVGALHRDHQPPPFPPPGGPSGGPFPEPPPSAGAPRSPRGRMHAPPDIRAAVDELCARAAAGRIDRRRIVHARDTLTLAVTGAADGTAAYVIRGVPIHPGGPLGGWSMQLGAMAGVTLVMVAVMVSVMLALRRGALELESTLVRLEGDLRADVPKPRAKELADIAARLQTMAVHLADARDRERSLERELAHQARLSALGRIVAGVAHEIRNPLTGVKLLLDGIARRAADARTREEIDTCRSEIGRLDLVVTSLLGVARDERTEATVVELGSLVDERIALATGLAEERAVTVRREGDGSVTAERGVITRVLDNLLRNAIEASPGGGAVVVRIDADAEAANVAVEDEGPGVPAARLGELFEPFFTMKPSGTGLGLWLSRALAESRGGSVEYARDGARTRFSYRMTKATPKSPT